MDNKIPSNIIKELDINDNSEDKSDFEVTAIVESHQIKLPLPRKLIKIYDLEFKKGQKLKLTFDEKRGELKYKI
jgi:hypothetical protein